MIEAVIVAPTPMSMRTWAVVAPFSTASTVPLIWLRALIRMGSSCLFAGIERVRDAPETQAAIYEKIVRFS